MNSEFFFNFKINGKNYRCREIRRTKEGNYVIEMRDYFISRNGKINVDIFFGEYCDLDEWDSENIGTIFENDIIDRFNKPQFKYDNYLSFQFLSLSREVYISPLAGESVKPVVREAN